MTWKLPAAVRWRCWSMPAIKVGIIDLTDGEPTPLSPGPDVRMAEAKAAGEALGVHLRTLLHLPNRRLFDSFEARVKLAIEFRKHRPRLVIGLGDKTPMASPDHWQAMQITDAAVFYSRLTKWDEQFEQLAAARDYSAALLPVGFAAGQPDDAGRTNRGGHQQHAWPASWRRFAATRRSFRRRRNTCSIAWTRRTAIWAGRPASSRQKCCISPRPIVIKDLMRSLFE